METSRAWVELALETLGCNQQALSRRIGVSPTQITKWKSGERMSFEMEKKFRALLNLADDQRHPEFVLWAGSVEAANKWDQVIHRLAEEARDAAETPYDTDPLTDDDGLLSVTVCETLGRMGVDPPRAFPKDLDPFVTGADVDADDDPEEAEDDESDYWRLLSKNPYTALIRGIFESLNNVWAFYAAYVNELVNDDELAEELSDIAGDIEYCLMDLAASKIEVNETLAPTFQKFRMETRKQYQEWLTIVKDRAFRAGVPLRAELQELVSDDPEDLGHTAEAEGLGFNASRLHPDVYMNELLSGMRIIHQVLPAIMKKLGIDDFALDESHLHNDAVLAGLIPDEKVAAIPPAPATPPAKTKRRK
jgi:transcriptional regulator with XRE-family HTH domain